MSAEPEEIHGTEGVSSSAACEGRVKFAIDQAKGRRLRAKGAGLALAAVAVLVVLAGCNGSSSTPVVVNPTGVSGLPTPPAAGPINTYIGTQSPGLWSLSLNDTTSTYSYEPVSFPASPGSPNTGSFTSTHGFLRLIQPDGSSRGYALEIPGRMALLRPGGTTAPLVISVPQTSCYPVPYRLRLNYLGLQAGTLADQTAVPIPTQGNLPIGAQGSFVVNTSTDGSAWTYQNLQGNAPVGPAGFSGTCAVASGQATMSLSGEGLFNQYNYSDQLDPTVLNPVTTMAIGPSGIFMIDQTDTSQASGLYGAGVAGVAQPSDALTTTYVAAGQYLGFITEAPTLFYTTTGTTSGEQLSNVTSPISFGQTASSGTAMVGGIFPNDDVTQTPNADTSIKLGAQDSTIHGLYLAASVTTPDPLQYCASYQGTGSVPGTSATGFATCTYPAIAVVGNPEGKYVIFLYAFDYSYSYRGTAMQMYLYQQ